VTLIQESKVEIMTVIYAKVDNSVYLRRLGTRVSAEARETHQGMIAALTDPRERSFRQKLTACGSDRGEWCNLPMCPICVERTQRSLTKVAAKCLLTVFSVCELPIVAIQADLPGQRYKGGDLCDINLPSLNQQIQEQYTEAGFPLAFSGVGISLIEDDCAETEFWQADVCSVIVGLPKRDVMRAIKRFYPQQLLVRSPDLDLVKALQSTIEPQFFRQFSKHDDGSQGTRRDRLWGRELRRAAHCFIWHKMSVRYVLTGCRLTDEGIKLNSGVRRRLEELADRGRRGS
jgi:hypothetical protein